MPSPTLHLSRHQKLRRQRERARNLCSLGVYTLILTPIVLGMTALYLFGLPGGSKKSVQSESWPPNENAVSAAATEAQTANGDRLKIFRFTANDHEAANAVQKFSAAHVYPAASEASRAREFILSLGPDEAIAPRDLAKNLRCAQTAVLEAASDLDAYISLSIDGKVGSYIAHPRIVAQYRVAPELEASSWAGNPAPGDLSLPRDPSMPGAPPAAIPSEFPSLTP